MATPAQRKPSPRSTAAQAGPSQAGPSQVDPRWLLRTLLIILLAAAILAYCALCLLVFMGSRQYILHPSPSVDLTPAAGHLPFQSLRFDAAPTGVPRLTAWWIPASTPTPRTILLLHDARGSLASTIFTLNPLHQANVNIFAFDYRGFTHSDSSVKPTQASMAEDTAAALNYLIQYRHIPPAQIVPYGVGLAAQLAAQLALDHPQLPAVIIDDPDLTTVPSLLDDPRARLLPMRLLVRDQFSLAPPLNALTQPRLLISCGPGRVFEHDPRNVANFYASVPAPKFTLSLPTASAKPDGESQGQVQCTNSAGPEDVAALTRFLDENLPTPQPPQRTAP